jgi:autotransporter adhesin
VAIGNDAQAKATHATALGYKAAASANQSTAVGRETVASGTYASAVGNLAKATAEGSVAVGNSAVATHASSVALGSGAVTTASNQISVGNGTTRRTITHVADGALSATSTDAVTGKQLNTTNLDVAAVRTTANAAQTAAAGARTTADSALGKANALGGLVSQVSATGNVRLGGDNTGTVLDVRNKSDATRRISGLGDGTLSSTSTEAVTGKQLNATNTNVTTAQNTATAAQTAAAGAKTTADSALGKANALGGLVSQVSATGNVRLGGDNTGTVVDVANKSGAKRRVNNVANGILSSSSTDVVTGQQLYATNQSVSTQGQSLVLHGQQLATHTQSLAAQDVRVSANRIDIDKLRADVDNFDPDLDGVVKFASDGSVDVGGGVVRNVAAGDISSATSKDAVNGGQLFATNAAVLALEESSKFMTVGGAGDQEAARAGLVGVALGDSALASPNSEGGVAVGSYSSALGKNSVALGRAAYVSDTSESGFALGVRSSVEVAEGVALGAASAVKAGAVNAVAVGANSIATESATVSFGNGGLARRLVYVARGTSDDNATNVGQLKDSLATLGGGAGMDGSGNVVAPTYAIQGSSHHTVGDALAALDGAVITSESRVEHVEEKLRSVFQDNSTLRTDGLNQIVLAGANGAVLTNLAEGRIAAGSRDAVTGSQLYAAKQDIARNRNDIEQMKESGGAPASQSRMVVLGADRNIVDFGGSRLSGVQAGDITSTTSTDAVNGGQLFATNAAVIALEESSKFMTVGGAGDQEAARAGLVGVALGDSARASLDSEGGVAVGSYASALGKNSVALGRAAYVSETSDRGFALGVNSSVEDVEGVALGAASAVKAGAINAVAVGANSIATESATVSFGNGGLARRLVYVARGTSDDNATNVGQLKDSLATLGGGAGVDGNGNVVAPTYAIQGSMHRNVVDALAALDGAVITTGSRMDRVEGQLRSVFQESPSTRADGLTHLTFAGANGMVLSNVGNGLIAAGSRDAVNGGQLHNMQQQLNGRMDGLEQRMDGQPQALQSRALTVATAGTDTVSGTPAATPAADEAAVPPPASSDNNTVADVGNAPKSSPQPKAESPKSESPTPQVDTAELEKMLARANEYTDGAIKGVEQRLDKMDKRFNRMAAMSSAQTAMAMNTAGLATYNRLGAGVGYAEGESAMAVGYQRVLNEKGSATFSLNGAFTNSGEQSVGLGVGIGW